MNSLVSVVVGICVYLYLSIRGSKHYVCLCMGDQISINIVCHLRLSTLYFFFISYSLLLLFEIRSLTFTLYLLIQLDWKSIRPQGLFSFKCWFWIGNSNPQIYIENTLQTESFLQSFAVHSQSIILKILSFPSIV